MPHDPIPGSSPISYALRGVIGVLFGLYMVLTPGIGIVAFVIAYGAFSLVDGVIASIAAFLGVTGKRIDWRLLIAGMLGILVGLIFLFRPGLSIVATSFLLGVWLIAVGLSAVLSGIQYRKVIHGEWFLIIAGLIAAGFGVYLLLQPVLAIAILPFVIGIYALVWGALLLAAAVRLWRARRHERPGEV